MLLLRVAISPELRGLSVKQFRTFESSGTLAFKPACHLSSRLSPIHFLSDAKESLHTARIGVDTDRSATAVPAGNTIFTGVALSPPEGRRLVGRLKTYPFPAKTCKTESPTE